ARSKRYESQVPILTGSPAPASELEPGALAEAYRELADAESAHQARFRDALDPEAANERFRVSVANAVASRDHAKMAQVGGELFLRDLPSSQSRTGLHESTRCAGCHSRGRAGGPGGLIDDGRDG